VSRVLDSLRVELEAAGLKPGTEPFEREFRSRKVQLCKETRRVTRRVASCWDCDYFDHCELIKAHLRDLYKVEQKKGATSGGGSTSTSS